MDKLQKLRKLNSLVEYVEKWFCRRKNEMTIVKMEFFALSISHDVDKHFLKHINTRHKTQFSIYKAEKKSFKKFSIEIYYLVHVLKLYIEMLVWIGFFFWNSEQSALITIFNSTMSLEWTVEVAIAWRTYWWLRRGWRCENSNSVIWAPASYISWHSSIVNRLLCTCINFPLMTFNLM